MLLTKASEYALLSVSRISNSQTPIDAQTLASTLGLSRSFLAKILQKLTRANILVSYKGMKGGFVIAKDPSVLTILEIIQAVEDNGPAIFDCSSGSEGCKNNRAHSCMLWPLLCKLQLKVDDFLAGMTLSDLASSGD